MSVKRVAIIVGSSVAVLGGGLSVVATSSPPPFAATLAAAEKGRSVPISRSADFAPDGIARIVGRGRDGQEYAVASGARGICLVAVRDDTHPGFEVCSLATNKDLTASVYIGKGRVRQIVLQAAPEPTESAKVAGGERVAPGLVIKDEEGTLPGG